MKEKLQDFISRLKGATPSGDQYKALCPAHNDRKQSLTVKEGDNGGVILHCHAGCPTERIVEALGLEMSDLFANRMDDHSTTSSPQNIVAQYDYEDEEGNTLFQQVRLSPKGFLSRRPDGSGGYVWSLDSTRRVLYRLPNVLEAVASDKTVYIVEGEKDADRLSGMGLVATTSPGGAGKWREEFSECLKGASVVIVPDNDSTGIDHGVTVANSLQDVAASVKLVQLKAVWSECPDKGDISDFLDADNDLQALLNHVSEIEEFNPATDSPASADLGVGVSGELNRLFRSTRQLAEDSPDETPYIVEGLVYEGSVTLLTGSSKGSGKSTLITHLVTSIVEGSCFAGMNCVQGPVVILTEQSRQSFEIEYLKPRGLMGRDDVFVCYRHESHDVAWQELVQLAFEKCRESGSKFLAIDTFAAFAGLSGDAENNAGTVIKAIEPVVIGAAREGIGVLIAHHSRKSGGEVWESGRGSSALSGAVEVIANLQRTEGQRDTMRKLQSIGRFASSTQTRYLELTENGYVDRGSGSAPVLRSNKELIPEIVPESKEDAMTVEELLSLAQSRDPKVRRTRFEDGLREHVEEGTIKRRGEGVKGKPHRYSHHRSVPVGSRFSRKGNPIGHVPGESHMVVEVSNGLPTLRR